jgi:hypothetical protein
VVASNHSLRLFAFGQQGQLAQRRVGGGMVLQQRSGVQHKEAWLALQMLRVMSNRLMQGIG